jgi:polyisoprenoid-binding protein YceI
MSVGAFIVCRLLLQARPPLRHFAAICLALTLLGCAAASAATRAEPWRIDAAHTSIAFRLDAVGFPQTHGHFTRYSGRVLLDFERPAKSYTSFTVESASVELGSPVFNEFVKGSMLLDVNKFPTLSFSSTSVEKVDGRTARVTGDLTMLGVTKPVTLSVSVDNDGSPRSGIVSFVAVGTIKRSDYGMIFGIPLIDDALEITVKTRALTDE